MCLQDQMIARYTDKEVHTVNTAAAAASLQVPADERRYAIHMSFDTNAITDGLGSTDSTLGVASDGVWIGEINASQPTLTLERGRIGCAMTGSLTFVYTKVPSTGPNASITILTLTRTLEQIARELKGM